jgi:hypothetical protein
MARHAAVRALCRQGDILPLQLSPWHLALVAGDGFCAFLTAWIYSRLLQRGSGLAWLAAGFLSVGFLTHLVLDESIPST